MASLQVALKDMTQLRLEEKAQNEKIIADAVAGEAAVTQALQIITNFFGAALVQEANATATPATGLANLAPVTFSGEYKKSSAESASIKGLLEIIAADYQKASVETGAAETSAAATFVTDKARIEGDISSKDTLKGGKQGENEAADVLLVGLEADLKSATELHAEAVASLEALKTSCVQGASDSEATKKAREQEIDALKQANQILEQWS